MAAEEVLHPASAVHLADAQRVLSLFAEGIAGHYVHLRPTASLRGDFRTDAATSDGNSVYLPETTSLFSQKRFNFGWYRVAILHQLGYVREGTFTFRLSEARQRFELGPLSDRLSERAVDLDQFFHCFAAPNLLRRLFMTMEDIRVDAAMVRRYPGVVADLNRVKQRALSAREPLQPERPIAFVLEALVAFSLGASPAELLEQDLTEELASILNAAQVLNKADATVYDSAGAAITCYQRLVAILELLRTEQPPLGEAGEELLDDAIEALLKGGGDSEEGSQLFAPVDFRGELQPEAAQRQLRMESLLDAHENLSAVDEDELTPEALAQMLADIEMKEPGSADPFAAPENPGAKGARPRDGTPMSAQETDALRKQVREQKGTLKRLAAMDRAVLRRTFGDVDAGQRSFLYDEWDYLNQRYLKGYCRLFEHRLKGDDFHFLQAVHDQHADLAHAIKRQFRLIKPESYERIRRVHEGEELDLDALIDAVVDRRTKRTPDDRVFVRRDRARREVAAAFLLDMSASTDDVIPDPNAAPVVIKDEEEDPFLYGFFNVKRKPDAEVKRRRVIDIAKESLALMCEALETLGDQYAVYGFSGYGHDDVEFHVAKEFAERLTAKTWAALSAMKPRRSTRMGPAIRHCVQLLDAQDVRMKVMIMISDGFPQDCDYGPDRTDHEYGIQDTAKALAEAQQRGVQTFCVTIDRAGHDYLRRMCADSRYLVIDEVAALPDELTKVYRALTL